MKITQTLELSEKERKVIEDFIYLMDNITKIIPGKSIVDLAEYFCANAGYYDGVWEIDALHQINEM